VAAAAIVLVTWYVARFAGVLLARLLESAGFDALRVRIGFGTALGGVTRPLQTPQGAVMFFAMLFALGEAANPLGFTPVREQE
jgi:hypothetical protein